MKQIRVLVALIAILVAMLPFGTALGQQTPSGPIVRQEATFDAATPPAAPFEEVQMVVDFAPGASVAAHTHGGPAYITMIEGEITLRADGVATTYRAGDTFTERPGVLYEGGNTSAAPARLVVTYLVPKGASLTTLADGGSSEKLPPGPTTVAQSSVEVPQAPADFQVVQRLLEYPAGVWTPPQVHGGDLLATVIAGQLTARQQAEERTYVAGDTLFQPRGQALAVENAGSTSAQVVATVLLPAGAALATSQPAAPAPAGQADLPLLALLGIGVALVAIGRVSRPAR